MSNLENRELTSLMKVLNEAEAEVGCDGKAEQNNYMKRQKNSSSGGDAQGRDKNYVWDKINEESLLSMDDSGPILGGSTCQGANGLSNDIIAEDENERASSIREKIRKMKREDDVKSDQLLQLKTTLARKKAATERQLKLIKDDWEKRFDIQKSDHNKKLEELNKLVEKNALIISGCEQKKKLIENDLLTVEQKRSTLITVLEEKGRKEVLQLQLRWKNDERKRLAQLTKQKTADLKKEAAKALEPELRRIVKEHKVALQRKREEIEMEIKTAGEEMKVLYEEKYTVKRRDLETEERCLLQHLDDEYEHKMKMLGVDHEDQIRETQIHIEEEVKKARAKHLSMIRREEEVMKAKISNLRVQNEKRISEARRTMKSRLEQLQCEADDEMKQVVKSLQIETQKWQSDQLLELEKKFANLKTNGSKMVQLKAKADVQMIEDKLQSELDEKKKSINRRRVKEVRTLKVSLEKEIDKILMQGQKLRTEHDSLLEEKVILEKEMNHLKFKLKEADDKMNDMELTLENTSHQLKQHKKELEEKERSQRTELATTLRKKTRSSEKAKEEIQMLETEINFISINQQDDRKNLLQSQQIEIEKAEEKIRNIFKKKQQQIEEKREEFSILTGKLNELDFQLAMARKDQVAISTEDRI